MSDILKPLREMAEKWLREKVWAYPADYAFGINKCADELKDLLPALDVALAEKDRRIAELEAMQNDAASLLASATDLLNSWAREMAVKEAYDESDIKGVIDRLWNELSMEMSRSAQKGALLRNWLKESPNKSVENVLSAIEGK